MPNPFAFRPITDLFGINWMNGQEGAQRWGINPATGQRDNLLQWGGPWRGLNTQEETSGQAGPQYGWESENQGWQTAGQEDRNLDYLANGVSLSMGERPLDTSTDWFDATVGNPALYLAGAAGLGVAGGLGLAGAAGAEGAVAAGGDGAWLGSYADMAPSLPTGIDPTWPVNARPEVLDNPFLEQPFDAPTNPFTMPNTPSLPSMPQADGSGANTSPTLQETPPANWNPTAAPYTGPSPTTGPSALQWLSTVTGMAPGILQMLGITGAAALGIYGSQNQAESIRQIAEQGRTERAPYLNSSLQWLNDPNSYFSGPGASAMQGVLRGLSVGGNPANNPGMQAIATEAGLRDWRSAVTGMANIGLTGSDNRANLLTTAAGADRGVTSSLATLLEGLTRPENQTNDILRLILSGNRLA